MTTTPFDFLSPGDDLSASAHERRGTMRAALTERVAQRGRQRRRRHALMAGLLVTIGALGLSRAWQPSGTPTHPKDVARHATMIQSLPTRPPVEARVIETITTAPGIVERVRAKTGRYRILELGEGEMSQWLREAGIRPARIVVNGRSTVFALPTDSTDD